MCKISIAVVTVVPVAERRRNLLINAHRYTEAFAASARIGTRRQLDLLRHDFSLCLRD